MSLMLNTLTNMDQNKDQFIGPKKVIGVTVLDIKTPKGNDVYKVLYEGSSEMMTKEIFDVLATDIASDYSKAQSTKHNYISPRIIDLLKEFDVSVGEIEALLRVISNEFSNHFDRAIAIRWKGDAEDYVAGFNPMHSATLLEADEINNKYDAETAKDNN